MVVNKPNGDIRICADYKMGLNSKLCSDSYPLPNMETAFCVFSNMKYFAKIDLSNAYHQIFLNETSLQLTTINTPIELLR